MNPYTAAATVLFAATIVVTAVAVWSKNFTIETLEKLDDADAWGDEE